MEVIMKKLLIVLLATANFSAFANTALREACSLEREHFTRLLALKLPLEEKEYLTAQEGIEIFRTKFAWGHNLMSFTYKEKCLPAIERASLNSESLNSESEEVKRAVIESMHRDFNFIIDTIAQSIIAEHPYLAEELEKFASSAKKKIDN